MSVELFKTFVTGTVDYIVKHNANYLLIETNLNYLIEMLVAATGGVVAVPTGLKEIFDRKGLIGIDSYGFNTGTLTGPNYNLAVPAGAYWSGASSLFLSKSAASSLSMLLLATGTCYLSLDAAGNPTVSASAGADTIWQFAWDSSTHVVSAKALYAGVSILFDGGDYADMLTSAARAKTFTKVADRLEEIEVLLGKTVQTPASANSITVNWALGGHARILLDRATTTFTFTGAYDGQKCILELLQDEVGGREIAFGAATIPGTEFTFPVPLSIADKRDFLGFIYSAGNTKYNYVSLARGY